MSRLQEKQAEFLRVLRETGSAVKAREAVGVGSRAVRKWQEDESFLDQYNDAVEAARDAVVQKSRAMALEGDSAQVSLWMKVVHAELRPSSAVNVAVGVRTGGRLANMTDDARAAKLNALLTDLQARQSVDIVDVTALPARAEPAAGAIEVGEAAEYVEPAEAPSGLPDAPTGLSVEDLL